MAGITLNLVLEKPGKAFEWGDIVSGHVEVTVAQDCPAAALMVVFYCKGFSESKRFKTTVEKENIERKLFAGAWVAGSYSYPFEFVVPHGPFTYKGHVFEVTWHLGARVRVSGEEDIRREMEVTVMPAKKTSDGIKTSGEVVYTQSARSLKGFFGFSFFLLFLGLYVGWRNSPFSDTTDMGLFFFGGVVPMVLGLALLFFSTWQALVNRRIKKVEVRLGSRTVRAGGKIPCSLTFHSNLPFEVEKITALVTADEIVDLRSSSRGDGGKFLKHSLYKSSHELPLAAKRVSANTVFRVEGEVPVPEHIPYSINMMESERGMAVGGGLILIWE